MTETERPPAFVRRASVESDYTVTEAGCWRWTGRMDRNGYGKAYDPSRPPGKRVDWAHRVSYRVHVGAIAPGHEIDHECQNTACINPAHLAMVTKAEHVRRTMQRLGKDDLHLAAASLRAAGATFGDIADALGYAGRAGAQDAVLRAVEKGLIDRDQVPPKRLLTDAERCDIRDLYAIGIPQTEIGAWYGIDSSQISRICNGRTSGHARKEAS